MIHTYPNSDTASIRRLHPRAAIIRRVGKDVLAFDIADDAIGHPSAIVMEPLGPGRFAQ